MDRRLRARAREREREREKGLHEPGIYRSLTTQGDGCRHPVHVAVQGSKWMTGAMDVIAGVCFQVPPVGFRGAHPLDGCQQGIHGIPTVMVQCIFWEGAVNFHVRRYPPRYQSCCRIAAQKQGMGRISFPCAVRRNGVFEGMVCSKGWCVRRDGVFEDDRLLPGHSLLPSNYLPIMMHKFILGASIALLGTSESPNAFRPPSHVYRPHTAPSSYLHRHTPIVF